MGAILKDFDSAIRALDEQERLICAGMAMIRVAMVQTDQLPKAAYPIAVLLRWKGRRLLRKGTRNLLQIRAARDRMVENELPIREAMVRRQVWGSRR